MIYIYDGSVEGLLTAIFDIYESKKLPDAITIRENLQLSLTSDVAEIKTDSEKASRVEKGIIKNVGQEGFSDFIFAFCSDESVPEREMIIFGWVRTVLKFGKKALEMYNLKEISDFNDITHRVTYEIHRFKGFIRFRVLENGLFYAPYEPDNNITEFLLPYFAERNAENPFIIHDRKHNICGLYNGKEWTVTETDINFDLVLSEQEEVFQELWQQYYDTVTIASRKNLRLRRMFLPVRYRSYLTEFIKD